MKVRYFGRLRELLDAKREEYQIDEGAVIVDLLLKYIPERHLEIAESWRATIFRTARGEILVKKDGMPLLRNYLVLVGGRSSTLNHRLADGDEVTVLPPFGGG